MSDDDKTQQAKATNDKVDDELTNLLESALQDFSTTAKSNEPKTETTNKDEQKESGDNTAAAAAMGLEWSDDFIQQAASQFESNFANLLSGVGGGGDLSNLQLTPELFQQKLQQMSEAAKQVVSNPTQHNDRSADFASAISQTISSLNEGAEGLQNPFSEDDIMKLFSGGGQPGQENDLVPFMQGMMQGLLSKEVLGPSLQDFVERYPGYIEANRDKLDPSDLERYENQKKLIDNVLEELNKEKESDSPQEKTDRFTKVLEMMQKLHDYGQPPTELVGEMDTPFNFDGQGNPAGVNPDCSIM